jgi:hypothetical protein
MYLVPILALAAVCLIGVAWSPVFALVLAVPAAIAFLVFVGLSPRSDQTEEGSAAQQGAAPSEEAESGGLWGERRV